VNAKTASRSPVAADISILNVARAFSEAVRAQFGDLVAEVTLFGSAARGDAQPDSDADVLVLVRRLTYSLWAKIVGLASDVSAEHGVYVSATVMSLTRWNQHRRADTLLYRNISSQGVRL